MGEDCSGEAQHPQGGEPRAAPTIPGKPQAGNLSEEVG